MSRMRRKWQITGLTENRWSAGKDRRTSHKHSLCITSVGNPVEGERKVLREAVSGSTSVRYGVKEAET